MLRVYFGAVAGSAGADVGPIPGIVGPRNGTSGAGALAGVDGVDPLGKPKFGNGDSGVFSNPGRLGRPAGSDAAGLGLLASSMSHF